MKHIIPLLLLAASSVSAQVVPGLPYSAAAQMFAQQWTIEEDGRSTDISQVVLPIGVFVPISDGVEARLSTSYVSLTRQPPGAPSESVSGLSDVKLQTNAAFLDRRLLLGIVMNLPTGESELNGRQQDILISFVAPDLSVRANRFGEGFNVGGTLTYAEQVSPSSVLALAFGLVGRSPYKTTFPDAAEQIELNPGSETTITAAWIYQMRNNRVQLSTSFTRHGIDQVDDEDTYRLGSRIGLDFSLTRSFERPAGTSSATFTLVELYRFKNEVGLGGAFTTEALNTNGNYLIAQAALDYALIPWLRLGAAATGRFIGQNEQSVGNATVFEGTLSFTFPVATDVGLTVGGRGIAGSGTSLTGADRVISGLEGFGRISIQF